MTPTHSDLNLTVDGLKGVTVTEVHASEPNAVGIHSYHLQYTLSAQCMDRQIDDDDAPASVFIE